MHFWRYGSSVIKRCQLSNKKFCFCGKRLKSTAKAAKTARELAREFKAGDKVSGYTVNKVQDVNELYMTAVTLQHDRTGAQHFHAAREDDNNAFSVLFRTTPMDSTGVPHILEHTVLCGSQQFPIHDPFFKMLSRSLATFMNALTSYDWTMYPFSTQNPQDFKNLLSVYLDATFKPLLRELDFCQEGWRLEHEDPNNPKSPLIFKGVVYNEMKGVFSSPQNIFGSSMVQKLLPSHTYGVEYGGDPEFIPDLTWQNLKSFHASHYHPSNARFFTYGNFPLNGHLEYIDNYLKGFQKIPVKTAVPNEPRWNKPVTHHVECPPDPMAADQTKQTTVAVAFLLSDITDSYEKFVQQIVCHLLTDGETSPFYSALVAANIGSDYAPMTGYQGNTKEGSFSVGLQGIKKDHVEKVVQIIDQTLDKVIQEGFDAARIEAILHSIELGQKHQTSNFGFHLAMGLASTWNHDGDPVQQVQINQMVERFRKSLADAPTFLQNRVSKYFKGNNHRLTLTMSPSAEYLENQSAAEKKRLKAKVDALSDADRKHILKRGKELLFAQTVKEDLSCLPSLKVADIDTEVKKQKTSFDLVENILVQNNKQPTNGVTYLRLACALPDLSDDLLLMVPLFCNVLTSIGAGGFDYKWMSQQQELYTGGLTASPHVVAHHTNTKLIKQVLVYTSYCLDRNLNKLMELWTLIFNSPDFSNRDRLKTLIRMNASELASSVPHAGHSYAMSHAASTLNPASALKETFGGLTQVALMKKVAESSDLSGVMNDLHYIGDLVLNKQCIKVSVNATPEFMTTALRRVEKFLTTLPGEASKQKFYTEVKKPEMSCANTHFELPFSVNYVGQSSPTVPYTHPDRAALAVLSTLLSRMFLHREIREKGGAYGSGATSGGGVFTFFSYRDPQSSRTLKVFEEGVEWAAKESFTEQEVEQAKIAVFQAIDKPVTPGNHGMLLFLDDIEDQMRQDFRDNLFAVNSKDVSDAAKKYLKSAKVRGTCCLGPANKDFKNNKEWKVVKEG